MAQLSQMAERLVEDIRFAARVLLKNPGFALVAIIALGLGIGANSTIYSTLNAMVLHPLTVPELDRIVAVGEAVSRTGWEGSMAPANFRDIAERNAVFERVAAYQGRGWDANVSGAGAPERLEGYLVTPQFFPLLEMPPLMGRTFTEADPASAEVREVVISYAAWQKDFAGDREIVGRGITLNGGQATIIGVMPKDFDFPIGAQIWGPLPMNAAEMKSRADHTLEVIGRLKPGVSLDQARAELSTIASRLERDYPETNAGRRFPLELLQVQVLGETRHYILILMWSALFVLLLACANVANLQLARTMGQQKELALRAALGASRWRIARQVLVESTMLSLAGGAVGLLMAAWSIPVTRASVPPFIVQHIAGIKNIKFDGSVLAFTAAIALLAGILAGLIPALQAGARRNLNDALKTWTRGMSVPAQGRSRSILVMSEVALALILLVGASLMMKGFRNLIDRYPGYDASALSIRVTLPQQKYAAPAMRAEFYRQVEEKLAAIPGVDVAATMKFLPSSWQWQTGSFSIENVTPARGEQFRAGMQAVSPETFRALRIPLRSGRFLTQQDGSDSPPVAVITETMARRYWPNSDPIGRHVRLAAADPWRTIVGVAEDIKQNTFDTQFRSTAYVPIAQVPPQSAGFILRTAGDPMALVPAARAAVQSVDPDQPIYDIRTLQQLISDNASGVQYSARMMLVFALIALLLSTAGIYAVMAYSVIQRTHEIGVRIALGAQHADVLRMVLGTSLKLSAGGLAVGVPVAFVLMRVLASLLYGVINLDMVMLVALTMMLGVTGILAGLVPARRAMRVDPLATLRDE
jgi:putative ABC transport system permease protein